MTLTASARVAAVVLFVVVLQHAPTRAATDVLLWAAGAPVIRGSWTVVPDGTAAGGSRLANPDLGRRKAGAPLASPADYVELTFTAEGGVPYRIWIRGRAQDDSYENDSVWVQFSDSVTVAGAPVWRIGTTSAASIILEDCLHCGVSGWGWQDNGYGGFGNPVRFAASGSHTVRIQVREDGLSIDQIVLSPAAYFDAPPGAPRNDTTILVGGAAAPPVSIVRGPYLQQTGADAVTIVWATPEPGPAAAEVGGAIVPAATTFHPESVTGVPDYYQHEARVGGLAPATTYAYRLTSAGTPITDGTDRLTTAPAAGDGRVRFIVFGDSGTGSAEQRALASRMNTDTFDFALHTGDIAYGDPSGVGDASHATYQAWFFDVYAAWLRRRPIFPSMGNHDSRETNDWGRAYLDLFALPAHAGAFPDDAERYYSADYGPVHVVAIDTERAFQDPARREAQLAWLEADLASAAGQPWKIAVLHRPPFSSGTVHGSDLALRHLLAPIFERYGVHLALAAHEHVYERSVPWRTGADTTTQAVTYVVTGGGGAPLYAAGTDEWTAVSASEHHYVRVTIDGCQATIEAVPITGSVLDGHVLDRCAQAADGAAPVVQVLQPAQGETLTGLAAIDVQAFDDIGIAKVDLWIDGRLHASDTQAPYSFSWDTTGAGAGVHTLTLRAHDSDGRRTEQQRTVEVVGDGGSNGLPAGWQSVDIGPVALPGSVFHAGGTFTVAGSGADIWGTSDAFRFVFRPLAGDGTITARVSALSGSEPWAKAGVMIRASTAAGAPHAFSLVSLERGTAYQRRGSAGGITSHTAGAAERTPQWVRLTRTGTRVTAAASSDGTTWTTLGTDTIAVSGTVLAGLALTSHSDAEMATATFDSVSVTVSEPLPPGWQSQDIGSVGLTGGASESGGTFTVTGAGADVWGATDAFRFVWRTLDGDGAIVARVRNIAGPHEWTKAGVMMRSTPDPGSPHAFMLVSAAHGLAFQRRAVADGISTHSGLPGAAPAWVRLVRSGQTIIGSASADGVNWTEVGRDTIAAAASLHVGLAVTSHDASATATSEFDAVTVSTGP